MSEHTKEPWGWQKFGDEWMLVAQHGMRDIVINTRRRGLNGAQLCMRKDGIMYPMTPEHPDAQRIVACVNALAGIPDPAAAMDQARRALRLCVERFDSIAADVGLDVPYCHCTDTGEGKLICEACEARAALAALEGKE